VDQTDAQDAAGFFCAEAFGQVERVEISVPCENAAVRQECCGGRSACPSKDGHENRRAAFAETLGIGDAPKLQPRNCQQAGN